MSAECRVCRSNTAHYRVEEGQPQKKYCQRTYLLAGLVWKWILPKRDTPTDEMRGTFWDLTNMVHYKFGPQTTEGVLIYVFFISRGSCCHYASTVKSVFFYRERVDAWN